MPNKYPDSIVVVGDMVPNVRNALIRYVDSVLDDARSFLDRGYYDAAISELERAEMISEFIHELDSKIQFDEEEEAPI